MTDEHTAGVATPELSGLRIPKATVSAGRKIWVYNPHAGGRTVPERARQSTGARLQACAAERFAGRFSRLEVRFHGKFCYLDLYHEPEALAPGEQPPGFESVEDYLEWGRSTPTPLCRLRYFADDRWSFAFYSYASDRYEEACFWNGDLVGPAEEALEICMTVRAP